MILKYVLKSILIDTYTPHGVVDLDLFSEVCQRNQKTFSITSLAFLITPKVNQQ